MISSLTVGMRVRIVGDHPHSGKCGTYEGTHRLAGLCCLGHLIKLDDGLSCYVLYNHHFEHETPATPKTIRHARARRRKEMP